MRGLFYQHRPWQKLNCLAAIVAALMLLFFHGVLNLLSQGGDALHNGDPSPAALISSSQIHLLLTEPAYWNAQVQGFLSILSNIGLWLHIVWLPVSLALIIIIRALCTLTGRPRWQASLALLIAAVVVMNLLTLFTNANEVTANLAQGPAAAFYFSFAALWTAAAGLRGATAH